MPTWPPIPGISNGLACCSLISISISLLARWPSWKRRRKLSRVASQAAADLGLAAAGGADHQDVLGRHFVAKIVGQALAPPAVAQGHRDRALGFVLADDMRVERRDNGFGGEGVVHISCGRSHS
jgi:hypothetical protein